jgi:hypothetical protein
MMASMDKFRVSIFLCFALLPSCGKLKDAIRRVQKSTAPAVSTPVASAAPTPPAPASAPIASATPPPTTGPYATAGITTIADDCANASVFLSSSPHTKDDQYTWSFAKQALLAHPQFKISGAVPPKSANTITLQQYDFQPVKTAKTAKALVALCNNGATCNKLAAMYKNVVRAARPKLICGKLPETMREPGGMVDFGVDPKKDLPGPKDVVAQCARLAACTIAADHNTPGNPGVECQKKPADFKTQCALNPTCEIGRAHV